MSGFQIPVPPEFSFELCFQFLQRSPKELLHKIGADRVIKLLRADNEHILFSVKGGNRCLVIDILNGPNTPEAKLIIRNYVNEWFDVRTDLKPFYKMARKDDLLKGLIKKYKGYRIVGQPELFESLVWAVLGQQINLSFAYSLKQRFVEHFGERLSFKEETYYLFPSPQVVASLTADELLALQFSRQKANYTIGIAKAFADGTLSRKMLVGMSLEEAKEELMKIKGVGNWTANYALMKTFRYPDAFPLEDAGLHNAIRNQLTLKAKPDLKHVSRIFKKYKGWEAYATLYLWKSL